MSAFIARGTTPSPWLYVPNGWGAFWAAAKANAGSSLARIAFVGDSIGQIFDASSHANHFTGLLASALQANYGDGGSGWMGAANTTLFATAETSPSGSYTAPQLGLQYTGAFTITATTESLKTAGDGPGAVVMTTNQAAGGSGATITASVRGTQVSVWYMANASGGMLNWTIDGVAQTPINTSVGSGPTATTVSGLSPGSHTVVLTVATLSTGQNMRIYGVRGSNTSGVILDNFARSSSQTQTYTTENDAGYGLPSQWSGGSSWPCDLFIYALGVNDVKNGVAVDTMIDAVRAYLQQIRDAGTMNGATDILFVMPHIGQWETHSGGTAQTWHDWLLRLRGLAAIYGAAMVDIWGMLRNSYAFAQSLNYFSNGHTGTGASGSDAVHPSDIGHQIIYNALTGVPGLF